MIIPIGRGYMYIPQNNNNEVPLSSNESIVTIFIIAWMVIGTGLFFINAVTERVDRLAYKTGFERLDTGWAILSIFIMMIIYYIVLPVLAAWAYISITT